MVDAPQNTPPTAEHYQAIMSLYCRQADILEAIGQTLNDWHGRITADQIVEIFTESDAADLLPNSLGGDR